MDICSQCGKTAIGRVGGEDGHPLCVEHYAMLQQAIANQNEVYERTINMLEGQMYDIVGMPRPTPSFPERKPPVYVKDQRIQNMINIDRSVVGAINTGTIQNLEVSMSQINNSNSELAQALKGFTEAVGREGGLKPKQKQEIIDQLSVLAQEVERGTEKGRSGVIKAIAGAIKTSVQAYSTLHGLWAIVENLLKHLL